MIAETNGHVDPTPELPELSFGLVLTTLRKERGISQRELERRCRFSEGYVSRCEAGYRLPTPEIIAKLASALDCSQAEEAWLWHSALTLPVGTPYYATLLCVMSREIDVKSLVLGRGDDLAVAGALPRPGQAATRG